MQIGVVLPQTEIGNDPGAIAAYAQAVEAMGFTHILVFDHVLGANPERPGGWKGPYTYRHAFHEPFVLFGFLAAATRRVGLVTGIVILPQRQTALVAKQAAAVDVLSGGRLRLGVGVGWNAVEFEALGEDFTKRGRRIEEQVEVMRALWTQELVTFAGREHRISDAGLNPLPRAAAHPHLDGGRERGRAAAYGAPGRRLDAALPRRRGGPGGDRSHPRPRARRRPRSQGLRHRGPHDALADPAGGVGQGDGGVEGHARRHPPLRPHRGMGLAKPADHVETLRRFREVVGLK